MALRYKRKVYEIEAVKWTGSNQAEIATFVKADGHHANPDVRINAQGVLHIRCSFGCTLSAKTNDWFVKDQNGIIKVKSPVGLDNDFEPVP